MSERRHDMGMYQDQDLSMQMQQQQLIEPRALVHNETVQSDEDQRLMREDQDIILENPGAVHVRTVAGTSNLGKTTKINHIARVMENDSHFRDRLREKTGNPHQRFAAVHISLAMAMDLVAQKYGVEKPYLTEEHRREASRLMIDAVDVTRAAFTDHPDLTIGTYVELVGITEYRDLGRSTLENLITLPNSRIFLPQPDRKVEARSRALRNEIPIFIAKPEEEKGEEQQKQTIDEWLLSQNLIPGQKLEGRESELLQSVGVDRVFLLQLKDIIKQMRRRHIDIFAYHGRPNFRSFVEDQDTRFAMYGKWLPRRMQELGVASEDMAKKIVFMDNPYIEDQAIHMHFGRAHGEKIKGRKNHHFPLEILLNYDQQFTNIEEARRYFESAMDLKKAA